MIKSVFIPYYKRFKNKKYYKYGKVWEVHNWDYIYDERSYKRSNNQKTNTLN